jgi:hypothetical protein
MRSTTMTLRVVGGSQETRRQWVARLRCDCGAVAVLPCLPFMARHRRVLPCARASWHVALTLLTRSRLILRVAIHVLVCKCNGCTVHVLRDSTFLALVLTRARRCGVCQGLAIRCWRGHWGSVWSVWWSVRHRTRVPAAPQRVTAGVHGVPRRASQFVARIVDVHRG